MGKSFLVFDGGLGTTISSLNLDKSFFCETDCLEILNITAPNIITDIHKNFLNAGANVIETNTFSASPIILKEMGLENRCEEINRAAVKCAKEAIKDFKNSYIAASIGPGNKLPVLDQISVDELYFSYKKQLSYILAEGVDYILIETAQDILQVKTVLSVCNDIFSERNIKIPILVSFTFEEAGWTLTGSTVKTILTTLDGYDIFSIGINCGFGPDKMEKILQEFHKYSNYPISCMPNQGLPIIKAGKTFYPLEPDQFSKIMVDYIKKYNLTVVGGCCGTSYLHIKKFTERLKAEGLYVN